MTPDLSYYWEGAREWCEDSKWDVKKNVAKVYYYYHTQHPYLFFSVFFLFVDFVSIILSRQKTLTDYLFLVQYIIVVHPERRY